VGTVIR